MSSRIRNPKLSPYNQLRPRCQRLRGNGQALRATHVRREQEDRAAHAATARTGAWKPTGSMAKPWAPSARRSAITLRCRRFEQQGYGADLDKAADVSHHPVLKQFPTRFVRDSATGNKRLVVLTKDRRHPFVTVTEGEPCKHWKRRCCRSTLTRRRRSPGTTRVIRGASTTSTVPEHEPRETAGGTREQQGKVQRPPAGPAEIWTQEPGVLLENYPDVFEGGGGTSKRLPNLTRSIRA